MGGRSLEREISLVSGAEVARALRAGGHQVETIDVGPGVCEDLAAFRPEVAFNALHGRFGEDGAIQGLLETIELAYTHSGVLASALAMDKPASRTLFGNAGIRCPEGTLAGASAVQAGTVMDPPYVVKPTNEGSSVGVVVVEDGNPFAEQPWEYGEQVLVERYIPGRELSVAVMGGEPLGVIEIEPRDGFYDFDAKYAPGGSAHVMPADVPKAAYDACMEAAATAHHCLGCSGVTRADLRYDGSMARAEGVYLLEINTQPGMTPTSLVPEIAAARGMDFGTLVEWMMEDAGCQR